MVARLVPAAKVKVFPVTGKLPFTDEAVLLTSVEATNWIPTVSPTDPSTSAKTLIVLDPPAGTVKIPVESLKETTVEATEAESVNLIAPSNKYTFVKVASAEI